MVVSASMATKKRKYHHGDVPRALVASAVEIIERDGPDALTVREAVKAVGVTHGAAYRHFKDKDELLAAVAEEAYRRLRERLVVAASHPTLGARTRLRMLASAYVNFAIERPAFYRVMAGPRLNEDGRFPGLEKEVAECFAIVTEEIEKGVKDGVFRPHPARDLAITVWIAAHGFVDLVLRRRIKVKSTKVAVEYFERLIEPVLDGLVTEPRHAKKKN
jgi:AcrR family transcriptional regulator